MANDEATQIVKAFIGDTTPHELTRTATLVALHKLPIIGRFIVRQTHLTKRIDLLTALAEYIQENNLLPSPFPYHAAGDGDIQKAAI